ncbi:MAG TPA: hypothetical protein VEB43_02460 [Anaeromyxobacter sp.]|nr:hypothetical protein [Anaeromyxobacter sp.]
MTPACTGRGAALGALAALALAVPACEPGEPGAAPAGERAAGTPTRVARHAASPRLAVEVMAGAGAERRGVAGVEVRLLAAEELEAHLARRRERHAAALEALRREAARLDAAHARLRSENDAANQAWMRSAGDTLRDRAALNLQPHGSVADVRAARQAIALRRVAAREKAAAAAQAALAAEERAFAVRAQIGRLERESFLRELPAGRAAAHTGPDGRLEVELPAGRYVAVGLPPPGWRGGPWLAPAAVDAGTGGRVVLDDAAIPDLEP